MNSIQELSEHLTKWQAAALAALAKPTTKVYRFEDGSPRRLIVDLEGARFYIAEDVEKLQSWRSGI